MLLPLWAFMAGYRVKITFYIKKRISNVLNSIAES
jgi:hypothetical protein